MVTFRIIINALYILAVFALAFGAFRLIKYGSVLKDEAEKLSISRLSLETISRHFKSDFTHFLVKRDNGAFVVVGWSDKTCTEQYIKKFVPERQTPHDIDFARREAQELCGILNEK